MPIGHLFALHVTPANEQDRAQVTELAQQIQQMTGEFVEVAFVDQGYTGTQAATDAEAEGVRLEVVNCQRQRRALSYYRDDGW